MGITPPLQSATAGHTEPFNLLDGEPVATQMLHSVYVIVAEEAQADLAEGAGWYHLCHSHLQGERWGQESSQPPLKTPPAHRSHHGTFAFSSSS